MAKTTGNEPLTGENEPETEAAEPLSGALAPRFRGSFRHVLDEKGRVSLPSTFRDLLHAHHQKSVVITNFVSDGARCLEGFSLKAWEAFEKKLANRSRFDPEVRRLESFYMARAVECPVDSSGRINIASHLRQYAGLERDVVFAASLHGFRIWDARVWELVFKEAETALLENPALFLGLDKE